MSTAKAERKAPTGVGSSGLLGIVIVTPTVPYPDDEIPDADEREERAKEAPKANTTPLAEFGVDDGVEPV